MLNIALPTGRLGGQVYQVFKSIDYSCDDFTKDNRKLVLENKEKNFRFFLVKPADVAIYVEHGVADIGVAGKDILLETNPDVYELADLQVGKCKISVAAPKGFQNGAIAPLKVATKYVNIAKEYYASKGREIEVIQLSGSIELAPILGLSDVIVDIVETGTTLRENNLEVTADIMPISARLLANKASYKFKAKQIQEIVDAIQQSQLDQQKGVSQKQGGTP